MEDPLQHSCWKWAGSILGILRNPERGPEHPEESNHNNTLRERGVSENLSPARSPTRGEGGERSTARSTGNLHKPQDQSERISGGPADSRSSHGSNHNPQQAQRDRIIPPLLRHRR